MNVVLLRLALKDGSRPVTPALAIYSLASCLRQQGHDVTVLDPMERAPELLDGPDSCSRLLADADLVGASVDTLNLATTMRALSHVRLAWPELPIVVGGVHATHMPHQVAAQDCVDYVVTGAGERPLSALVRCLETGDSPDGIPGLYRMEGGALRGTAHVRINYDDYPVPAYDLVPHDKYQVMSFETSRGCPGKCSFCSIPDHNTYYPMSIDTVLQRFDASVATGHDRYLSESIYITDDCFTANPRRAMKLAQEFVDRGYVGRIAMEARVVDLMTPGMIEALSILKPGMIQIGVECGYDEGLKLVRKGITTDDVFRCADRLVEAGLGEVAMYTFIVGLPWETEDLCAKTVHFEANLIHEYGGMGSLSWFSLLPSQLWYEREKYGINVTEDMFLMEAGGNALNYDDLHPNLSYEAAKRVARLIDAYQQQGTSMTQSQHASQKGEN